MICETDEFWVLCEGVMNNSWKRRKMKWNQLNKVRVEVTDLKIEADERGEEVCSNDGEA